MKINDKKTGTPQVEADRKGSKKARDEDDRQTFKELMKKGEREDSKKKASGLAKKDAEASAKDETLKAEGDSKSALKDLDKKSATPGDASADADPSSRLETSARKEASKGLEDSALQKDSERFLEDSDLSSEDKRALMQGGVPGVAPTADSNNVTTVKQAQPLAPSQSKHEVTEKLLSTIVSEGYVTEDVKGRKVVMMQVDVPGRGTVNMRLWRRSSGVELRMRADDPKLASEIRRNRGQLEAGARERGIHFSKIEVVG